MSLNEQIHATCVAVHDSGVVIRGQSGSGKSDLALRLIDGGARLVADDRVDLKITDNRMFASAPENIQGLLEIRGMGIAQTTATGNIEVKLLVDLVETSEVQRLPKTATTEFMGQTIRYLRLNAFEASTPAKIRFALKVGPDAMVEPT